MCGCLFVYVLYVGCVCVAIQGDSLRLPGFSGLAHSSGREGRCIWLEDSREPLTQHICTSEPYQMIGRKWWFLEASAIGYLTKYQIFRKKNN